MSISTYDRDFYAWLDETISAVRDGRLEDIDREILIDELESMGKRDRRELISRLVILIAHLLKWSHQPGERSSGWVGSIAEQRLQILGQIEDSPSLQGIFPEAISLAYPKAVGLAVRETGLSAETFEPDCPLTVEQLLDEDFYPTP